MAPRSDATGDSTPEPFRRAVASVRSAVLRPDVEVAEAPAPQRLAPYALALTADLVADLGAPAGPDGGPAPSGDGTGRLVVLHDPRGQEAWEGTFRVVTYVRADLDPEMAADPVLPDVAWSWLEESLLAHDAALAALGGTVTCVTSVGFGDMASRPARAEIEIRASWSPRDLDLGRHVQAWTDLLGTVAGRPPVPPGVVALPTRRGT